jgi:hypothetical protein
MNFQRIVLTIALILLIISLVAIGLLIKSAMKNTKFPPEVSQCPDYFKTSMINGKLSCANPMNLGKCSSIDLGNSKLQGTSVNAMTAKCNVAKGCGVTWDGVTNVTNHNTGRPYC